MALFLPGRPQGITYHLSKQYHPDKINHLNEVFRKVAEEKMKVINEAYQYLKMRGVQG